MVEAVLAITIFLIVGSLLIYFYFREFKHIGFQVDATQLQSSAIDKQFDRIEKIVESRDNLLKDILDKQNVAHLKHIQALEKQSQKNEEKFTNYVANDFVPPVSAPTPNDIEKTEDELKEDSFSKAFANIPITPETKVMFEGDASQLPEEIL